MKKENSISRRSFLKSSALAGALGAIGTGSTVGVLTSCGGGESANAIKPLKEPGTYYVPELPDLVIRARNKYRVLSKALLRSHFHLHHKKLIHQLYYLFQLLQAHPLGLNFSEMIFC